MPESGLILEKLTALSLDQTRQTEKIGGILEHLARLNGSVSKHEQEIGKLLLAESRRSGVRDVIAALAPALWVAAGGLVTLILLSADKFLALHK